MEHILKRKRCPMGTRRTPTMKTSILTDWTQIRPIIWHCNVNDKRLYMFLSPSGKSHIAEMIDEDRDTFQYGSDPIFKTLCNRTFKFSSKWRRPNPVYDLIHNPEPDPFLEVTCPRCKKLEQRFRTPYIKIDRRPHTSESAQSGELYLSEEWDRDVIPNVLHNPLRRCETCNIVCNPATLKRRRNAVKEQIFHGYMPTACDHWYPGLHAKRQDSLRLTDEQLESLSKTRLNLIYQHLITTPSSTLDIEPAFHLRVLKALKGNP